MRTNCLPEMVARQWTRRAQSSDGRFTVESPRHADAEESLRAIAVLITRSRAAGADRRRDLSPAWFTTAINPTAFAVQATTRFRHQQFLESFNMTGLAAGLDGVAGPLTCAIRKALAEYLPFALRVHFTTAARWPRSSRRRFKILERPRGVQGATRISFYRSARTRIPYSGSVPPGAFTFTAVQARDRGQVGICAYLSNPRVCGSRPARFRRAGAERHCALRTPTRFPVAGRGCEAHRRIRLAPLAFRPTCARLAGPPLHDRLCFD